MAVMDGAAAAGRQGCWAWQRWVRRPRACGSALEAALFTNIVEASGEKLGVNTRYNWCFNKI